MCGRYCHGTCVDEKGIQYQGLVFESTLAIVKSSVTLKTWAKYPPRSTKHNTGASVVTPGYTRVSRTAPGLAQCMSRLHYPKLLKAETARSIFPVAPAQSTSSSLDSRPRVRSAIWSIIPSRNRGSKLSRAQERIEGSRCPCLDVTNSAPRHSVPELPDGWEIPHVLRCTRSEGSTAEIKMHMSQVECQKYCVPKKPKNPPY